MSKSNKLLMKLIKASGGWENLLYETLKEICVAPDHHDEEDAISSAREIIVAYEDQRGGVQVEIQPMVPTALAVPVVSVQAPAVKPAAPAAPPPLQPRKMKVKVTIDTDAGWCQGGLPLPAGYRVVNKGRLTITTVHGMEMAKGNGDGQVKSQDVSGQITDKGKYRLVFKDVNLGTALIHFEIMPIPPAPVEIRPPAPVQPMQVTPAMVAAKAAAVQAESVKAIPVDSPRNADGSSVKQMG